MDSNINEIFFWYEFFLGIKLFREASDSFVGSQYEFFF